MAKVGIKDIAARAGVSIATVSHAFRNPGRVSDATREKVLEVADVMGYSPDRLAASLRTARSGNIVAIIPDIADSYNGGIIKGIERAAHARGYSVLLGDTQGSAQRERDFAMMARTRQADGIILMSHRIPFDLDDTGQPRGELPPLVNGSEFTGYEKFPTVAIDDVKAAADATAHLVEYGHRDIAVITGEAASTSTKNRLKGFREAMAAAGLKVDDSRILVGEYSPDSGESCTEKLLLKKQRPTAIFCFSDEIAIGCMNSLREHGFKVPDDVSIIGFDDIPFAKYFYPPLTTIAQPTVEIGRTCASILIDLIEGKHPQQLRHVLPHKLVVRETTRRI